MRITAIVMLVGFLSATAAPARAQALGDIAKKEQERRKDSKDGKVFTNKDLKPVPSPPPSAAATPADAKPADDKASPTKTDENGKGEVKDQAYWSSKINSLREQLDRDKTFAVALQSRINALNADFTSRDDPAQRAQVSVDRLKALTELERLTKQIEEDVKAIAALEEEARRAGVPPGWLR